MGARVARPRSEDKRQALLKAATETFASEGLSAPTSLIARRAGVAEGTLFLYFPNKDALFGAVFEHVLAELATCLTLGYDATASLKERTRLLWDNYVNWGIEHPAAYAAMNQLSVSGKLTPEQLDAANKLCADVGYQQEPIHFAGLNTEQSTEFSDALLTAVTNATIGYMTSHPTAAEAYRGAGFEFLWRAIGPEEQCS